ncbi:MAG: hypothetical protein IPK10_04150 [Bacteroidetes bacterium]|nr:hypothetical protein [Bacteroidota bacterium]
MNLGGASIATFGPDVSIEGKLNVEAGGITLNGGSFADDVSFVKWEHQMMPYRRMHVSRKPIGYEQWY